MSKSNLYTFSPSDYQFYTAPLGTQMPTTLGAMPAGWYNVGFLSDAGIGESHNFNETKIFDMVGKLLRIIRNQEERPFTFECTQYDAVVSGLKYPGSTVSSSGGTAEVQTITLAGTPTGGTFPVTLPGYGTTYVAAYNVTASALQSALQSAWGIAVTVTLASNVYTIAFPTGVGNVPQIVTSSSSLTPAGATATAATTTPGVNPTNTRIVGSGTTQNLRQFAFDLFDGTVQKRVTIGNGEAIWTGNVTDSGSAIEISQFTCNPFPDPNIGNGFYTLIDNAPGQGLTYA